MTQITPHFSWEEAACHSGEPVPMALQPNVRALCTLVLEPVRLMWDAPLFVTSLYRSPSYNAQIGGAEHSAHMEGMAADIHPEDGGPDKVRQLYMLIEKMHDLGQLPGLGGLGNYPGKWVHVDIKRAVDGHLRRWTGAGIGSEQ